MAKRFTDSEKWKKSWFRKTPTEYKLFWFYLLDNCNNAGVWDVDEGLASYQLGAEIDLKVARQHFGERIIPIKEDKWFIPKFNLFQYGKELSPDCPAHKSAIRILENEGLTQIYEDFLKGSDTLSLPF